MTRSGSSRLPASVRGVRAAWVFLSRVPVGGFPYRAEDWRWAPAHFPLVGAGVGCLSGLAFLAARPLGVGVAATLALTLSVLATGAFHEDGLADTADALGGAHGSKQILEILKDSRIGTYGALAVMLSLLLRWNAIVQTGATFWSLALVHTLARVGPVWLLALSPYVASEGAKSRAVIDTGLRQVWVATGWGALILVLSIAGGGLSPGVVVVVPGLALVMLLARRVFLRAAAGITGDFLGAAEQLGEVAAWLTLLAMSRVQLP